MLNLKTNPNIHFSAILCNGGLNELFKTLFPACANCRVVRYAQVNPPTWVSTWCSIPGHDFCA